MKCGLCPLPSLFPILILSSIIVWSCKNEKLLKPPADLKTYTIAFGGDVFMGRRLNEFLFDKKKRHGIFGDTRPLLRKADMAILNCEGVIAKGGRYTYKGENVPYAYRAHPLAIDALKHAGIDIVTVGNNHVLDYGPDALVEMLDRLTHSDIGYTGAGYDLDDAMSPAYYSMGDVVVAVVGADLTVNHMCRATERKPGTFFRKNIHLGENRKELILDLKSILAKAKKRAHVVIFSPHWGDNYVADVTDDLRKAAKEIIGLGFDAIVGHSAHWFHGVEILDGKPVIYDAGNFLIDYSGNDEAHRALLWELDVTKAGVTEVRARPTWITRARTRLADSKIAKKSLSLLKERSEKLGASVEIEGGVAVIKASPGGMRSPSIQPEKRLKRKVRLAPTDVIADAVADDVQKVNVEFQDGIRLLGFRLLQKEIPATAQIIKMYWTTDKAVDKSYLIHLEARGMGRKTGKPIKLFSSHLPGDWMLPTNEWEPGKIIRDWSLFRMTTLKPVGRVEFYAGLWRDGQLIAPLSSDVPLHDDKLVYLGDAVFNRKAKKMFEAFEAYLKETENTGR